MRNLFILLFILLTLFPNQAFGQSEGYPTEIIEENPTDTDIDIEVIPGQQPTPNPLQPPYPLTAESAVVIEQSTGKVLHGKDENIRMYPASTTKILTALVAAEYGDLDEVVTVGDEIYLLAKDGSMAGLTIFEEITLRDLIYGLLINSGNDAANTIAVHIARKVSGKSMTAEEALAYFADLMNERAQKAGAKNSHFVTPHGYHNPDHYTTAYDLALIGRDAMKNTFFREAISTTSMVNTYWNTGEPRYWSNRNRLLNEKRKEYYPWAVGGKTGYTSKAGQCLVSFASKNDMDLVTVVLKTGNGCQWSETRDLFEYGFNNHEYFVLLKKGTIMDTLPVDNYSSGDWGNLAVMVSAEDWGDIFNKRDIPNIKQEIIWEPSLLSEESTKDLPRLEAPIAKGQKIGELRLILYGKELVRSPLAAVRDIRRKAAMEFLTPDLPDTVNEFNWLHLVAVFAATLLLLRIVVLFINRKRRRRYVSYRRY